MNSDSTSGQKEMDLLSAYEIMQNKRNPLDHSPASFRSIEGIDKLKRSIAKEIKNGEDFDEKCSNLPQLIAILNCILLREKAGNIPFAVLKPFNFRRGPSPNPTRFIVDVVSKDRDEWIKVSARNPKSLALLAAGGGGFGQKSILDHANEFLQCAEQNHSFFKPPKVIFVFSSGIGFSLAQELELMGIQVEGEIIQDSDLANRPKTDTTKSSVIQNPSDSLEELHNIQELDNENPNDEMTTTLLFKNPSLEGITKLNLDITALLAFVSNLTNGHTNVRFNSALLNQQLGFEQRRPQKQILESIFQGRKLFCCKTAYQEFQSILFTVGGPKEKERGTKFLKDIVIVPDNMSPRSETLELLGNIKRRSLTIFGTGDSLTAVTVTANSGFIRSAASQGIEFPVFIHESRALTESKENL